jgi:hypothetical protein
MTGSRCTYAEDRPPALIPAIGADFAFSPASRVDRGVASEGLPLGQFGGERLEALADAVDGVAALHRCPMTSKIARGRLDKADVRQAAVGSGKP